MSVIPEHYTVPEMAEELGCSKAQVYILARRGELPHIRFGRKIIFPVQQVKEHFETLCQNSLNTATGATTSNMQTREQEEAEDFQRAADNILSQSSD